jgi:hypothetical protein
MPIVRVQTILSKQLAAGRDVPYCDPISSQWFRLLHR